MKRTTVLAVLALLLVHISQADIWKDHQGLMHRAIITGNVALLNKLLDTPYVDVNDLTPGGFYLDNALQCNFPEVISALMAAGVRSVTYPNGRTSLFTPVETGHPANLEVFADILRKQMSLVDLHEYVNTQRYQWWHSPHESRWRRIRFFKLYGRTHAIETCDVFSFFGS